MERNIDQELDDLQPPEYLLRALTPSPHTTVKTLMALPVPRRAGHYETALKGLEWFSTVAQISQNDIPSTVSDITLSSARTCRALDDLLRSALEEGYNAVEHPVKKHIALPLWLVRTWKWGNQLLESRIFWVEKMRWIDHMAEAEMWLESLSTRARQAIQKSPWKAGISWLE